jgi:alpha-1,4-digalacturonate transport system substrate-binding protein
MKKHLLKVTLIMMLVMSLGVVVSAQDPIEVTFTCYQDGTECDTYADLLSRFTEANPGIVVTMEVVPYQFILESLPVIVEVGEGPDIARITNYPGFSAYYLDMRPYMMDPSLLEDNFNSVPLAAFRGEGDEDGLHGFPDAVTATAPFVNATLFEQAGIELLGEGATWDEWMDALTQVRDATGVQYAFTIDNRGHRFAGPAMSMGANFFNEDGMFALAGDEGFTAFAEMLKSWLDSGLSAKETWATGDTYTAANEYFINVQTVMYFSGSWQIGGFANTIGDAFDWVAVPNPTGPGGSTGVVGGAGIAAFDSGDEAKNAAITAVMEYLLQPEVYAEFSGRTLSLPAHAGALALGIDYQTDNPQVEAALTQFGQEVGKLQDQAWMVAFNPFSFAYFAASNTRLAQYFFDDIPLEEVTVRIQADIDDAVANAGN